MQEEHNKNENSQFVPSLKSFIPQDSFETITDTDINIDSIKTVNSIVNAVKNVEDVEYSEDEDNEENPKDKVVSMIFVSIAALTLIAGISYYLNSKTVVRESLIPELYVSEQDTSSSSSVESIIDTYRNQFDLEQQANSSGIEISLTADIKPNVNTELFSESTSTQTTQSRKTLQTSNQNSPRKLATTTRQDVLNTKVVSSELGVSFLIDSEWRQITNKNSITLKDVGPSRADTINIVRFKGASVSTEDAVQGNVTYFYDTSQKTWMKIEYGDTISSTETIQPTSFVPVFFTKYNKPIFEGTTRAKTLILAFSADDFLIVNISGSGYTAILDTFVREITNTTI